MDEKIRVQILDIIEDPVQEQQIDLTLGTPTGSPIAYWAPQPFGGATTYNTGSIGYCTTSNPHYLENILSTPLIIGESYVLNFSTFYMQSSGGYTGYLGFDTLGGISANARIQADGSYTETFVATGTQVRIAADHCYPGQYAGYISMLAYMYNVSIRKSDLVLTDNVVGDVDITDSQDFPLALTYAVSDGKDLEQRFGDYSKTFDLPPTDNNNKLFNHVFNVKINDSKDMTGLKPCRILVNELEFFRGFIKVGGSTQTKNPTSYQCTIYGGNYGWISKLKNQNLCDIYDKTHSFDYTYTDIMASFNNTQANSELVFPLISYGDFWPNPGTGYYSAGYVNLVDNVDESQDWRPSFWIYNMLDRIFSNIGYTIESNFINSSDFKKLISHYPPTGGLTSTAGSMFATRKYWNLESPTGGSKGIWDSSLAGLLDYQIVRPDNWVTGASTGTFGDTDWQDITHNEVITDPDGCYDGTTGEWTSPKSGRYNFFAAVHLLVGDFTNHVTKTGVAGSGAQGTNALNVEVGIRIVQIDQSGNYVVGSYDNFGGPQTRIPFRMQWGQMTSQSSGAAPYAGTDIPVLMAVEKQMSNNAGYSWWVPQGNKVKVQVQVRFHFSSSSAVNPTNAEFGYISLSDEYRKSLNGGNVQHFFNGDSYYSNVCQGYFGGTNSSNYVGAVRKMWAQNSKPYFKVEPVANEAFNFGENYLIQDCLPCDIKQTSFIKALSQMFNLQFRTDPQAKKVYIEPFDDFFFGKADCVDWTNKIDFSTEIKDTFAVGLHEEMVWEYKNDGSDGLMKFVNESFRESDSAYHFFNHIEDRDSLGDRYTKGTFKFTNQVFASTWSDWNADASGQGGAHPKLMPVINKTHSIYGYGVQGLPTRPDKITKYAPRIMKYRGNVQGANHSNFVTTWNYQDSSGASGSNYSPRATFVDWEDVSGGLFNNLSFSDEIISPPLTNLEVTVPGLYTLFWKNMIEKYKANPRIRTYNVKLSIADMVNVDLRKLVYIDGSYWRINKIIDFAPAKNELTKVEFMEWTDQYPIPTRKRNANVLT